MSEPLLSVKGLRTVFRDDAGEALAVDGVTFEVAKGEVLGLVGESGCGKTATALSIMGLLPKEGSRILPGSSIRLGGEELVGMDEARLNRVRGRSVAMVFQEPMTSLNPVLTVGRQIAEGMQWHLQLSPREARQRSIELLREVGIDDPVGRRGSYPHQLSGGMRQRVLLAMALASKPDLLIADEPTTALDATIQAQILQLFRQLRDRRGLSLLLITHDLGVVAEVCDRVAVMYAGQIVETGRAADVFSAPAHPYTRALLDCLPRLGEPHRDRAPISGAVPTIGARLQGCRFAPRCARVMERCRTDPPKIESLDRLGVERDVRCWFPVEEGEGAAI